jgi:NADH:ubiquinone oxidoreductase subunit 6 (subunit J)
MVGMLQIITYLLAVYLIVKGVEVLQIALASNRERRAGIVFFGAVVLFGCIIAAAAFVQMQDTQAKSVSQQTSAPNTP